MNKRKPRVGDVVVMKSNKIFCPYAGLGIIIGLDSLHGHFLIKVDTVSGTYSPWWFFPGEFEVIDHDEDLLKGPSQTCEPESEESNNPSVTFQETPSGGLRRISPKPDQVHGTVLEWTQTCDTGCGREASAFLCDECATIKPQVIRYNGYTYELIQNTDIENAEPFLVRVCDSCKHRQTILVGGITFETH